MPALQIDFISDIACPWCAIGLQALELAAGAANLSLMGLNIRDGLKLSGRLRPRGQPAAR